MRLLSVLGLEITHIVLYVLLSAWAFYPVPKLAFEALRPTHILQLLLTTARVHYLIIPPCTTKFEGGFQALPGPTQLFPYVLSSESD